MFSRMNLKINNTSYKAPFLKRADYRIYKLYTMQFIYVVITLS